MRINRSLIGIALVVSLVFSSTTLAAESVEQMTLPSSSVFAWVKTKEWIKINLLTFKPTSKASLYNGYSDRRVSEMKYADEIDDKEAIEKSLARYEIQKQKSFDYALSANDKGVMERIRERTLEQQRDMTQLQLNLDNETELQENIVRVQKQVATESKNCIETVEGTEVAQKTEAQTWVVWRDPNADINGNLPAKTDTATLEYAPGTGPGGGGRVYEGGSGTVWAPGTSTTGSSSVQSSGTIVNTSGSSTDSGTTDVTGNDAASGSTTQNTVVEGTANGQQSANNAGGNVSNP